MAEHYAAPGITRRRFIQTLEPPNDVCMICHEDLRHDSPVRLPCGHWIGTVCVREYAKEWDKCPACKFKMFGNQNPHETVEDIANRHRTAAVPTWGIQAIRYPTGVWSIRLGGLPSHRAWVELLVLVLSVPALTVALLAPNFPPMMTWFIIACFYCSLKGVGGQVWNGPLFVYVTVLENVFRTFAYRQEDYVRIVHQMALGPLIFLDLLTAGDSTHTFLNNMLRFHVYDLLFELCTTIYKSFDGRLAWNWQSLKDKALGFHLIHKTIGIMVLLETFRRSVLGGAFKAIAAGRTIRWDD